MNDELPAWLLEEVQDARRLLGVGDDWHITVKVVDHPNGDADNDGTCYVSANYLNATIEFARDMTQNEQGRHVILHEILHVAYAEIDQVVKTGFSVLPKGERGRMKGLYEAAVERVLQRMSRAIARRVSPVDDVLHAKGAPETGA